MKKHLLFLPCLFLTVNCFAQLSKVNYSLAQKMADARNQNRLVGLFVKGNISTIKEMTASMGGVFKYSAGDIASIILPVSKVSVLASSDGVETIEDSYIKMQLLTDSIISKNNVLPVHAGMTPLPQSYDGTNVVMGIIDTGIDFTHPDFKDASGNTRVKYVWDHNMPDSLNTPLPYNYGQEFTEAMINSGVAIPRDTYPYPSSSGHGTHVSGVAAGNGLAINHFTGMAPKTDIICVALNFNAVDWLGSVADAINYIFTKANLLGKPCVINISAGDYYGSHDGKDLQAQMIDNLITQQTGRTVVAAAGNAGNIPFHMQYNTTTGTDTLFTWFNTNPNPVYMEMWADAANFSNVKFTVGVDKISPDYEFRGELTFKGVAQYLPTMLRNDTIYSLSGNRLAVVQTYATLSNGRYSMIFNVIADSTQYNYRLSYTGSGKFDLWSFQLLYSGLPTVATFPAIVNYHLPDLDQTIVSSFTCSNKVITVGNYQNRNAYIDCLNDPHQGTELVDTLAPNSSHGPTRTGLVKPDISSAGSYAFAPVVTYNIANIAQNRLAQGCMHMVDGGTSTAAPGVAGIAALYLQRYPNATWQDVKEAITLCCKRDNFTGFTGFPKNDWGYGKVDGFMTLTGCAALGIHENETGNNDFYISPNPFSEQTIIHYELSKNILHQNARIVIYDLLGNKVRELMLNEKVNSVIIKKEELNSGVYMVRLKSGDKIIASQKMVIL